MLKNLMKKKKVLYLLITVSLVLVIGLYLFFEKSSQIKINYNELNFISNDVIPNEKSDIITEGETKIGSNENLLLYYNKDLNYIKIVEQNTNNEWTSYFPLENYNTEGKEANKLIKQSLKELCNLSFSNLKTGIESISSADSRVITTTKRIENGIIINVDFRDVSISLDLAIWLDKYGLCVKIPKDKIKDENEYKIVSLDILPQLGSATKGDNGLIVFPDGSGSVYELSKQGQGVSYPFIKSIYSGQKTDIDEMIANDKNGVKNIALPCYGLIKNGTGFVTFISEGAESSKIILAPYGHITKTSRIYTNITYRNSNSFKGPDGDDLFEYDEGLTAGDLTLHYFFKAKKDIGYIDLANTLQIYLVETNKLKANNKLNSKAFIELICATSKKTLLYKDILKITSFEDALSIVNELEKKGIDNLDISLLGWQDLGYLEVPSDFKIANKIGGEKELISLNEAIKKTGGNLFLNTGVLWANDDIGSYNKGNDIIKDFVDVPLTNKGKNIFLLNAFKAVKRFENSYYNSNAYKNKFSLSIDDIGRMVTYDLDKKKPLTKEQSINAYRLLLNKLSEKSVDTAFQTANSYVLPYANRVYNLADNDSDEMFFDYEIPFYQAVLHGYVSYSGEYCGNMSSDFIKQKLKWAEYGQVPYFIITKEDASELRDTKITDVFGTSFDKNEDLIVQTVNEFEKELGHLKDKRIINHKKLMENVFVTTYENGDMVYVNYSQSSFEINEEVILEGKSFKCIRGGKLEKVN